LAWFSGRGTMENEKQSIPPITTCFSVIQDPWIERNKLYPLDEIIVITILAAIAIFLSVFDILTSFMKSLTGT
jgi:hypothetical protein